METHLLTYKEVLDACHEYVLKYRMTMIPANRLVSLTGKYTAHAYEQDDYLRLKIIPEGTKK